MYAGKMGKTVSVKKYKNREKQTMKKTTEFTPTAFILGILLAVVFGGANAYLGLRVGMTVSASIPAAVISMGIVRLLLKRDSILENNMVQTIGSAGESLAAGAIFTLPALFMWAKEHGTAMPSFFTIAMLAISGGLLGVLFMVPLRHALIVEELDRLPYPEGTACSKVLLAGEEGGAKAKKVLKGLLAAAVYKFLADGLKLFPSEVDFESRKLRGAGFGIDVLPALVGVGYICGARVSSYLLSGAVLGWLVLMPAFVLVGGDNILFPATRAIGTLTTWELWGNYIRYIGAGAVAAGGIISLVKALPLIVTTFRKAVRGYGNTGRERTERDIPMRYVIIGIVAILLFLCVMPQIRLSAPMALFIAVFGFFFATVSARMVGLVGSSNNPVSGMAIATLLLASFVLKLTGQTGLKGMTVAISMGTVICIVAAMAGDTSQDLKTGFIVGATPWKQQVGELIGAVVSGLAIGGVLYLLQAAWSFGDPELPAPQATLMKLVVEGVMGDYLPWGLILIGVFIAVAVEIVGIPVLPFSIGLYLPIHLSTAIMVGGLLRAFYERKKNEAYVQDGILFSSGLIAGEGLIGILLAVTAVLGVSAKFDLSGRGISLGAAGSLAAFLSLLVIMICVIKKQEKMEIDS